MMLAERITLLEKKLVYYRIGIKKLSVYKLQISTGFP